LTNAIVAYAALTIMLALKLLARTKICAPGAWQIYLACQYSTFAHVVVFQRTLLTSHVVISPFALKQLFVRQKQELIVSKKWTS
jgi:hypothetical protein